MANTHSVALVELLEITDLATSASTSGPGLASQKRAREECSSESAPLQGDDAAKRTRHHIARPGIPVPTPINSFTVPDRPSPPPRADDKDGHYVYELGENLTSRYKILSKMGEGTFGRVLECWDRKHKDYVAIKIVRNIDKYRHAAMIELEVLNTLERNDQEGAKHCVALREWFDYRGHVCMVFEKLGPSLFDFLRRNEYRPFPLDLVQEFSRQLLESVAYLHELQLIHTDLKPENILLCSLDYCRATTTAPSTRRPATTRVVPASSCIKVIDFGSATFEEQHHSSIVSTRHYRAPEVILGLGWSFPCDMWSVGCIMVELLTGDALFQTHENLEHLAMMEQVLGQMPQSMASRASKVANKYFAPPGNRLLWPDGAASKKSVKAVQKLHNLRRHIMEAGDSTAVPHIDLLVDLLQSMLRYEPGERVSAEAALQHPFFKLQLPCSIPASLPSPQLLVQPPSAPAVVQQQQQQQQQLQQQQLQQAVPAVLAPLQPLLEQQQQLAMQQACQQAGQPALSGGQAASSSQSSAIAAAVQMMTGAGGGNVAASLQQHQQQQQQMLQPAAGLLAQHAQHMAAVMSQQLSSAASHGGMVGGGVGGGLVMGGPSAVMLPGVPIIISSAPTGSHMATTTHFGW